VTGLRSLDRNLGGFQVADLADHDHVRVLTQKRAQGLGEIQTLFRIDVDLIDAFHVDLHRVFSGGDIDVDGVEDIQPGVQRHGFARAGGAGDQNHPLWLLERGHVQVFLRRLVAKRIDAHLCAGGVEDPDHHFFAPQGRQGVDPEIDRLALRQAHLDPPVLRFAPLRNVEAGHDFQSCGDAPGQLNRRLGHLTQDAVGAHPHAVVLFVGFEVQVGGAALDCIEQHLVNETHHRRIVGIDDADGVLLAVVDGFNIEAVKVDVGHFL